MCICVRSLVGEGQKVSEKRAAENKNSVREDRGRSAGRGSVAISEQWFSLTSGSGVHSLGIDLFKIQSSAIDKLGVLKSLSKPNKHGGSQHSNRSCVKSLILFSPPPSFFVFFLHLSNVTYIM